MKQLQDPTFGQRLRRLRLERSISVAAAARATPVATNTWGGWEAGRVTPKLWRCGAIARALGVPVAALFTDELVVADVVVSAETVARIRAEGRDSCVEVAQRLAAQLEPVIWNAVTTPPVDIRPGARPKRRRTRAEVLAGVKAAGAARAARQARSQPIE